MEDKITPSDLIAMNNLEVSEELNKQLLEETDPEKLKQIADLFNMIQAKKDILRLEKYNKLVDAVTKQMEDRITKKPSEFSNKDLIDYLNAANLNLDKAKKSFSTIENTPSIQINQVNIESDPTASIPRESREKITQVISSILSKVSLDKDIADKEVEDITINNKLLEEEE